MKFLEVVLIANVYYAPSMNTGYQVASLHLMENTFSKVHYSIFREIFCVILVLVAIQFREEYKVAFSYYHAPVPCVKVQPVGRRRGRP